MGACVIALILRVLASARLFSVLFCLCWYRNRFHGADRRSGSAPSETGIATAATPLNFSVARLSEDQAQAEEVTDAVFFARDDFLTGYQRRKTPWAGRVEDEQ